MEQSRTPESKVNVSQPQQAKPAASQARQTASTPRPQTPAAKRDTQSAGPPPENLTITAVPLPGGDPSLQFDWETTLLGSNQSLTCTITGHEGHPLTATVEQGSYCRTLEGTGMIPVPPIPAASAGTSGTLTARDLVTGAMATWSWHWRPGGVGVSAMAKSAEKPRGLLSRLLGRADSAKVKVKPRVARNDGERLGQRAPLATTAQFFGHQSVGQRFAFVLDTSGSMYGPRWAACRSELERALNDLPDTAEFYVVLFSHGAYELPDFSQGTTATRARVLDAILGVRKIRPGGGTSPSPALERVFSLPDPPDVIYFLTDGEIGGPIADDCARLRGSALTIIHTISLDSRAGAETLQRIATESGGHYTHISAASGIWSQ